MISQESAFAEPHILVTGAAGLVGEELVKQLLEKRFRVRALYHYKPLQIEHPLLQTTAGDLLDVVQLEELMEGITHVYHCAAIVSFDPAEKYRMLKINVEGTANVVNACIDAGIQKLVYISSVAALGRIRHNEVIDENANWSEETNNSVYGRSKHLAELEVWRGVAEGLNAVIVNPTIILGGNDWHTGSAAIFKTAWQQFKWYTEGVTGFVDVMDVARAMILLMQSHISAQRFILNSENLTYREVFTEIAECFKRRPPYKKVSPLMAAIVWRLEAVKSHFTTRKHLLTRETARTAQAKVYFDNSKILEYLPGFKFTPVKETIKRTCQVMQQKYQLK